MLERLKCSNIIEYKHSWIELHKPNALGPRIPCLFILMQYANGESLEELLEGTRLQEIDIILLFTQIVQGVFFLHSNRIIHRDLKPSNILLHYSSLKNDDENYYFPSSLSSFFSSSLSSSFSYSLPQVLISDFGECIGEVNGGGGMGNEDNVKMDNIREGRTGNTGTLEFCAPEVLKGMGHSFKSDIWSLGLILHFMYFNKLPFENYQDGDLLMREICSNENLKFGKNEKNMNSKIKNICMKMLNKNPKNRPGIDELMIFFREISLNVKEEKKRKYFSKFLYIADKNSHYLIWKRGKRLIFSKFFIWILFAVDMAFLFFYCYPRTLKIWILAFNILKGYLLWKNNSFNIYFFLIFLFATLLALFNRRILCA